jgi:micrococcal nuclease
MIFRLIIMMICLTASPVMAQHEASDDLIHIDSKPKELLVLKVIASDIIVLESGQKIKLLGIDSYGPPPKPRVEYDSHSRPIEEKNIEPTISLEEQAIVFAQNLMEGKKVKLEYDIDSRDEKGYKTAYVYLPDGQMANSELLRQGFVRLKIRPPNVKHEDLLRKSYQEARKEQRGFLSY